MATRKVVSNSFALALDVDAALAKYLPELTDVAQGSHYVLALALLYRGFISLTAEEFPRSHWDFLSKQIMDLAEAATRPVPGG